MVFNWRNQINVKGKYSIHLRLTIGRVVKYFKIAVPQSVTEEQWMGKDDTWVKPNHPFAFEINNKIFEKKIVGS